jgi:hypothetical protein
MPLSVHGLRNILRAPRIFLFSFSKFISLKYTRIAKPSYLLVILLNHFDMPSGEGREAPLGREEGLEETTFSRVDIHKKNEEATACCGIRHVIQLLPTAIQTHLIGWKFGVTGWVVVVIMTLFINIGLSVFVGYYRGFDKGIGTLLQGECSKITGYNIGAHLAINILSTLLLSGSNYCMQCLSAPTRREINNAHKRGITLDIGIPSLRNLGALDPWKILMWILLGISSLPLHLLSVILSSGFNEFL